MEIDFQNFRQLMISGSPHMAAVGLELLMVHVTVMGIYLILNVVKVLH